MSLLEARQRLYESSTDSCEQTWVPDAQLCRSRAALGVEVVFASDRCHQLEDPWSDGAIALRFDQPEEAARRIVQQSLVRPVDGIIALGDRATTTAAFAARALGIAYNSPEAVENCRSKLRQREILRDAGLPVPGFFSFASTKAGKNSSARAVSLRRQTVAAGRQPGRDSREQCRGISSRRGANQGAAEDLRKFRSRTKRNSTVCLWSATFPARKWPSKD